MREQKRKEERVARSAAVAFSKGQAVSGRAPWAVSVNVSASGLCLYTNIPVIRGEEYRLTSDTLWFSPRLARTAWSTKIGDEIYKAGLSYV
jgi:hypothetical protein